MSGTETLLPYLKEKTKNAEEPTIIVDSREANTAAKIVKGLIERGVNVKTAVLEKGDYIVGMEIVGEKELMLSVTEKGYGKRTAITEYRLQSRAGKGVINVKTVERNGKVVGVLRVTEESEVMLISEQGKITRLDASKIRESGRSAQGVRLIALEEGDQVAAACLVKIEANGNVAQGTLVQ